MSSYRFTIKRKRNDSPDYVVADADQNIVYVVKKPHNKKQYEFFSIDGMATEPIAVLQRNRWKTKYEFFYDGELWAKFLYKYRWGFNMEARVFNEDESKLFKVKGGQFTGAMAIRAASDPQQLVLGKMEMRPMTDTSELYIDKAENEAVFLGLFFGAFDARRSATERGLKLAKSERRCW